MSNRPGLDTWAAEMSTCLYNMSKTVERILNRASAKDAGRVVCFPPLTRWPTEAKAKRSPGESASVMTMPDGSEAQPLRVYPSIVCLPGVTRDQEGFAPHGTPSHLVPRIPLTESHDAYYWEIVSVRAKKVLDTGLVELRYREQNKASDETDLQNLTDSAKRDNLKQFDDKTSIDIVAETDDPNRLLTWKAEESRPRVKKAITARLAELS